MENKTYKEIFFDNGLIAKLKELDVSKYNEVFGVDYDAQLLDDYICFSNGNQIVSDEAQIMADNNKLDSLAKIIWLKFFDVWKKTLNNLKIDYAEGFSQTETEDINSENSNTKSNNASVNNKISAWDSETPSNAESSESSDNSTDNGTNQTKRTKTISGYSYNDNLFNIVNQYKNFTVENIFCDVVKDDIISLVCLTIY